MKEETTTHPSFGIIEFTRVNGINNFFGSDLEQDHYIQLTISEGEKVSDLSSERFYPNKRILKARMTATQFSELITSLNIGSGVPCTLEIVNDKIIEKLPKQENRKEFVHRKFKDRLKEFSSNLISYQKEAKDIVKKKTLSKDDQNILINNLDYLIAEINSNMPFFAECFQEVMDEMVIEAKTEIEASILHKINQAGLSTLYEQQNKLLNSGEK